MSIRQDAKMGLRKMEDMGQMGNSDEATMPDDMPFGMADIMVIGDKGEPMEFANGGFVPSYAAGGLLNAGELSSFASTLFGNQDYDNQQLVNPPVNLTGDPYFNNEDIDINDVRNAAIIDPDPNYQPSMEELQTAYVPTTSTEEIDYDAYMNSVTTVTKEYRNAAGESVVITFINGVPTLPIPDGYTLYNAEAGGGGAVSLAGQVVAQSNTSSRAEDNRQDRDRSPVIAPEPINYSAMSDEEFASQMITESSGLHQFGRAIGIGVASMVPFGLLLVGGSMRSHARKSEARLNAMIEGASGEYKAELIAIRDGFLKANSLKPAALSNVLVAAADSFLMGDGYTSEQRAAASIGISSNDAGQDNEAIQNSINNILGKSKTEYAGVTPVDMGDGTFGRSSEIAAGNEPGMGRTTQDGSYAPSQTEEAIPTNTLPFDQTGVGDTQGDTGADFMDTYNKITPEKRIDFRKTTPSDLAGYRRSSEDRAKEKADAYYTTGAGRDGATSPVDYSNVLDPESQPIVQERQPIGQAPFAMGGPNMGLSPGEMANQTAPAPAPAPIAAGNEPGMTGSTQYNRPEAPSYFDSTEVGRGMKYAFEGFLDFARGRNFEKETTPPVQQQTDRVLGLSPGEKANQTNKPFPTQSSQTQQQPVVASTPETAQAYEDRLGIDPNRSSGQFPNTGPAGQYSNTVSAGQFPNTGPAGQYSTTQQQMGDAFGSGNVFTDPIQGSRAVGRLKAQLETSEQQKKRLKNENTNRRLRAEQAAADARQNNAFQNAANELTPDDGKEYQKGVLRSTTGKNEGDQINTAYQTAANLATPGDGNKYEGGILRNSAGKQINNAYQNAANALTKNDGRSYVGGKLMSDADPTMPYVASYQNRDRSTVDPNNPTGGRNTSAEAMAANMAAFKQKFGVAGNSTNEDTKSGYSAAQLAAANQRNIAAGSATTNSYVAPVATSNRRQDYDGSAKQKQSYTAPKSQKEAKARSDKAGKRNFKGRAEGGLIQKPAKTKKPTTPKTKKRGLAARK